MNILLIWITFIGYFTLVRNFEEPNIDSLPGGKYAVTCNKGSILVPGPATNKEGNLTSLPMNITASFGLKMVEMGKTDLNAIHCSEPLSCLKQHFSCFKDEAMLFFCPPLPPNDRTNLGCGFVRSCVTSATTSHNCPAHGCRLTINGHQEESSYVILHVYSLGWTENGNTKFYAKGRESRPINWTTLSPAMSFSMKAPAVLLLPKRKQANFWFLIGFEVIKGNFCHWKLSRCWNTDSHQSADDDCNASTTIAMGTTSIDQEVIIHTTKRDLTGGAIAGIIVSILLLILIVALLSIFMVRKLGNRTNKTAAVSVGVDVPRPINVYRYDEAKSAHEIKSGASTVHPQVHPQEGNTSNAKHMNHNVGLLIEKRSKAFVRPATISTNPTGPYEEIRISEGNISKPNMRHSVMNGTNPFILDPGSFSIRQKGKNKVDSLILQENDLYQEISHIPSDTRSGHYEHDDGGAYELLNFKHRLNNCYASYEGLDTVKDTKRNHESNLSGESKDISTAEDFVITLVENSIYEGVVESNAVDTH